MEKNTQLIKRENESLARNERRPVLLVQDISKLVNSSELTKPQYKSVKIGDQIWMVENLNVDHYRNGDPIPEIKDPKEWENLKTGAWCCYNNDRENGIKYGNLYNLYAVNDRRGLAPEGWHIPTSEEIWSLMTPLSSNKGNTLKAVGQGTGNGIGTNTTGFSALMAGIISGGFFRGLGSLTSFWGLSGTGSVFDMNISYDDGFVNIDGYDYEGCGFSVRCIKA